jgi:hypothetical protein
MAFARLGWSRWMQTRTRAGLLIAVALLIVAAEVGSWWLSSSAPLQQRAEQPSETAEYYDCPGNGSIVWCETVNAGRWLFARDHLTAVSTLVIAIFTCTLWFVTNNSMRLARAEFEATHRPRISVRGFRTLAELVGDAEISITFIYVNVGDLPAKIIEIQTNVTVGGSLPSGLSFDHHKIEGVTLASGDKEIFEISDNSFDMHFHRAVQEHHPGSSTAAYLTGVVVYEDAAGRRRETGFCRVSIAGTNRWTIAMDYDYEYQD